MSLLISGSLVYDHIMNFPDSFKNHIMPHQIHILNVCFVVDRIERSWGGTAGNIAFTVRLLGGDPVVLSAVGRDGEEYVRHLKEQGINTDYIIVDKKQLTASAYITTDNEDNQITAFFNGPLGLANNTAISNLREKIFIAIISPTQKNVMMKHLEESKRRGLTVVFDPGQQAAVFSEAELRSMISRSDVVIGNDYEIRLLEERARWTGREILQNTRTLVTTLGEHGSIVTTSQGEEIKVNACPPASVDDPTGAGDAYRAGFFVGYEKGLDLKTCAQIGSVAASYAIETYGTQEHTFTMDEFSKRYEKCYSEKLTLRNL